MPELILLAGPIGAGKTTACRRCVALAEKQGWSPAGILAPAHYDAQDVKVGIDLLDLASGARHSLADVVEDEREANVGRYRFRPEAMQWACRRVDQALEYGHDLIFIDEIGPLELDRGGGFAPILPRLASSTAQSIVIVVREGLVEHLRKRLRPLPTQIVRLTRDNRDKVPQVLLSQIESVKDRNPKDLRDP